MPGRVSRGAVDTYQEWTAEEDATLRAAYANGGIDAALAALPHRGRNSLYHRARRLKVFRRRRWTPEDDAHLRRLWNAELDLDDIAARLGRTPLTTYWRAQKIGLPLGVPDGWELITTAADRTGYATTQLRQILRAAGATIRRALTEPAHHAKKQKKTNKRGRPRFIVARGEVDVAIEAWHATEPVHAAARRLGMHGSTLMAKLRIAGVERRRPVGKPCKNARPHWRVSAEDIERALAYVPPKRVRRRGPRGWFVQGSMVEVVA